MIELKAVDFYDIQNYFVDFQKKSKCFEMPPEGAEYLGIYDGNTLVGYFITVGYNNEVLEINQGYLLPNARHKHLSEQSMHLLEVSAKKAKYKKIVLYSSRSLRSYTKFMRNMGYKIERILYFKEVI